MQEVGGGTFPTSVHTCGRHGPEPGQYSSYEAKQLPLILFDFQGIRLSHEGLPEGKMFCIHDTSFNKTTIKSENSFNFSRLPLEKEAGGKQ
jgi:hypothetical protein